MFDLDKTLVINLEIIVTILSNHSLNRVEKEQLLKKISNIKRLYDKQKQLRKEREILNSKFLISNQILEESKKQIDDNQNYYSEKIEDLQIKYARKIANSKKYLSSFMEVEEYVQSECLNYSYWGKKFFKYDISEFIKENELLIREKLHTEKDNNQIRLTISELKNQNLKLSLKETPAITNKMVKQIDNESSVIKNYFYLSERKNFYINTLKILTLNPSNSNKDNVIKRISHSIRAGNNDTLCEIIFTDTGSNLMKNIIGMKGYNCILPTNISKIERNSTICYE